MQITLMLIIRKLTIAIVILWQDVTKLQADIGTS